MALLNVSNISKSFGDDLLFDNISFQIEDNDKIGFVGANGAGKSTLFKIITGELAPDSGDIFYNKFTKTGYLEQYACSDSKSTIWQEMLKVFEEVRSIEKELEDIRLDIESGDGDIDSLVKRQTDLSEKFSDMDGFFYKSKIKSTLIGLGFSEDEFQLKTGAISGGQKTRLELGKILLSDANLLLLDEPTNHLDITSVEWLEDFLRSYKGSFIVISHDRYFLDRVTNRTFGLENNRFWAYTGSYSQCAQQREIDRLTEERNYENTMREIKRLEGIVEQQRRWNRERNIRTAESKLKVIERLEKDLQKPQDAEENIEFKFKALGGGGQDVLIVDELSKSFDGKTIFKNASFYVKKGEKIFLLGDNGCGKTTLLKIILGQLEKSAGEYKIGANIHIGYYDQLQQSLDTSKNIIDEVWDKYPNLTQTQVRNALAVFLFKGEEVFKDISALSGGERARVALTEVMLRSVNLLIMDEPTNHLDIRSREALEEALAGYDGTLLMVSHDRYFINKLADRILYLNADGIESFSGGYDEYIEKRKLQEIPEKKNDNKSLDYKERKQREAQKRKVLNRYKKVEDEISNLENEVELLNAEAEKIGSDYVRLSEITSEIEKKHSLIDNLFSEWESLQETIELEGYGMTSK